LGHSGGGAGWGRCRRLKRNRKTASDIDMNVTEFIVHAYPIQNEEFLLRFSHLTNYLDRYVASARQNRLGI
jgi:hypothetical protein